MQKPLAGELQWIKTSGRDAESNRSGPRLDSWLIAARGLPMPIGLTDRSFDKRAHASGAGVRPECDARAASRPAQSLLRPGSTCYGGLPTM